MTDSQKFPSQLAERFQIRMPDGLRDALRSAAERSGRSMNAEIVWRLERTLFDDEAGARNDYHRRMLELVGDGVISGHDIGDKQLPGPSTDPGSVDPENVGEALRGLVRRIETIDQKLEGVRSRVELLNIFDPDTFDAESLRRALAGRHAETEEDAADTAIYDERKAALERGDDSILPVEVSNEVLRGASRLTAIRKWRSKSPAELADAAGMSKTRLTSLEAGTTTPTDAEAGRLAAALDVPAQWVA